MKRKYCGIFFFLEEEIHDGLREHVSNQELICLYIYVKTKWKKNQLLLLEERRQCSGNKWVLG